MATLVELRAGGRSFILQTPCVIGRDPGCDIVLDDPKVSRQHVIIRQLQADCYRITDLDSRAGVFINGTLLPDAELKHGDQLRLGHTHLRFVLADALTPPIALKVPRGPITEPAVAGTDAHLKREYNRLRAAHQAHRAIGTEQRPEGIAERILAAAFDVVSADRGIVSLFESGSNLAAVTVTQRRVPGEEQPIRLSQTLTDFVVRDRRGAIFTDAVDDERLKKASSVHTIGMRSLMCVPIAHEHVVYGVMQLDTLQATHIFQEEDLELLTMIAQTAGLALANVMLRGSLEQLREGERLRVLRILDVLPTGLVLINAAAELVAHNPAGLHALNLLADFDAQKLVSLGGVPLQQVRDTPPERALDINVGDLIFSICARASDDTDTPSAVIMLQDVTRRRTAEARAALADRLAVVGRVASGLAHDFNNLLTVVNEGASYVMQSGSGPDVVTEASAIYEAGRRATALVRQLLTFSRQDPQVIQQIDLSEEFSKMQALLTRALGDKHSLVFELERGLPTVLIDPTHVQQLIMNLVVNAKDAMQAPGRVWVRTRAAGDGSAEDPVRVLVEVEDEGCGIPLDLQGRIFEPFFSRKRQGPGTGLGLATVYGIVEGVGGEIEVHSREGAGARFCLTLPASLREPAELAVESCSK